MIERLLRSYDTITVVGASTHPEKAAHTIPAHMQRCGWRIIPVNPHAGEIFGVPAYPTLADAAAAEGSVGLVNVFRPASETADVAAQAVAVGAGALWLQLGIASEQARHIAEGAGLSYVEDRCIAVERARLNVRGPRWSPR
jgi:predicted CoA-binding protein